MKIKIKNKSYIIDLDNGIDISIPFNFDKKNPQFYDNSSPKVNYYNSNNIEYALDKGGNCNVPIVKFNIHCSGTHTESANHIDERAPLINEIKISDFIYSKLISIKPTNYLENERYHCKLEKYDSFITKKILHDIINNNISSDVGALIIRTLPNDSSKINRNYNLDYHPFFTNDAILYLKDIGIKHIIVDTPSIDRYDDGGKLGNHHLFFKNGKTVNTITELVFIPNSCTDGYYFINLEVMNFGLDAAPSRPKLFPIL